MGSYSMGKEAGTIQWQDIMMPNLLFQWGLHPFMLLLGFVLGFMLLIQFMRIILPIILTWRELRCSTYRKVYAKNSSDGMEEFKMIDSILESKEEEEEETAVSSRVVTEGKSRAKYARSTSLENWEARKSHIMLLRLYWSQRKKWYSKEQQNWPIS